MPIATVTKATVKEELKTLPGAFVVIRRMTYGEKLQRREQSMKMQMQMQDRKKDATIDIDMLSRAQTIWSFANLILEHNLEAPINPDDPLSGVRTLDLKKASDISLLDPQIGEEIDTLIDKHNNFEENEEEDLKN